MKIAISAPLTTRSNQPVSIFRSQELSDVSAAVMAVARLRQQGHNANLEFSFTDERAIEAIQMFDQLARRDLSNALALAEQAKTIVTVEVSPSC